MTKLQQAILAILAVTTCAIFGCTGLALVAAFSPQQHAEDQVAAPPTSLTSTPIPSELTSDTSEPTATSTRVVPPTNTPTATRVVLPTSTSTATPIPLPQPAAILEQEPPVPPETSPDASLTGGGETVSPPLTSPLQTAQVIHVVDGDTIDVLIDGTEYRVRYILIDTPETKHPTVGVEPFGPEAYEANRHLIAGQTVLLEKDVSETDRYGRLLRYVYLDETTLVQEQLLLMGLAQVSTYPPDVKYAGRFLAAQRIAQENGLGIWGEQPLDLSPPPAAPPPNPSGAYDPLGPDRDCGHFATHAEAQAFFEAAGGPTQDPHRLDRDRDGLACETLP